MGSALLLAALASAVAWAGLLLARRGFWRADQRLGPAPEPAFEPAPEPAPAPQTWPAVTVVIPARDEAATVAEVLASHAASDYPGDYRVILVDDASRDATAALARDGAAQSPRPIHVVAAPPLAPGWSGKLHALAAGLRSADRHAPAPWLLLTDADIVHAPDTARRLVTFAEHRGLALASLMARLDARPPWGRLLIPAFVFFFQKLYPFRAVNDLRDATAAAAGGCVLVRREALEAIGGLAAIRGALIDDCTLAARIKGTGRAIWLGLATREVVSRRDNRRLASVWTMVRRTAFTQLDHSGWKLAGTVLGMGFLYLAGPLALLGWPGHGSAAAALAGALAWGLMALAYRPTLRLWDLGGPWTLSLPAAALLYTLMTLDSARAHRQGRGGAWKGRTYP